MDEYDDEEHSSVMQRLTTEVKWVLFFLSANFFYYLGQWIGHRKLNFGSPEASVDFLGGFLIMHLVRPIGILFLLLAILWLSAGALIGFGGFIAFAYFVLLWPWYFVFKVLSRFFAFINETVLGRDSGVKRKPVRKRQPARYRKFSVRNFYLQHVDKYFYQIFFVCYVGIFIAAGASPEGNWFWWGGIYDEINGW